MEDRVDSFIPKLGELLLDLPPVFRHFLDPEGSPYQTWFAVDERGEAIGAEVRKAFRAAAEREELASFMPLMSSVEKKMGTEPHPAVNNPGSAFLFGGRKRDFDMNARLRHPLSVGDDVRIRLSARLFGPAIVADGVFLSTGSIVMRSVIGPRTEVDDGAKIKDSLVGADVYIGQDAKLLSKEARRQNGDLISFECWFKPPGRLIPHRLRVTVPRLKMGCVVGDKCRVGAGTILMPGTILLPGTVVPEHTIHLPVGIYAQADINRFLRGR